MIRKLTIKRFEIISDLFSAVEHPALAESLNSALVIPQVTDPVDRTEPCVLRPQFVHDVQVVIVHDITQFLDVGALEAVSFFHRFVRRKKRHVVQQRFAAQTGDQMRKLL